MEQIMDTELKENLDMEEEVSMDGEPVREVCGIRSNMTLGDIMTKKPEIIRKSSHGIRFLYVSNTPTL